MKQIKSVKINRTEPLIIVWKIANRNMYLYITHNELKQLQFRGPMEQCRQMRVL